MENNLALMFHKDGMGEQAYHVGCVAPEDLTVTCAPEDLTVT